MTGSGASFVGQGFHNKDPTVWPGGTIWQNKIKEQKRVDTIGDDISMKSSNVKTNINNVCNLISVSSEQFNLEIN
jgi:hypothetical protein